LQGEARDLRQQARTLTEQLATHEADALVGGAQEAGGARVVCAVIEGRDAATLKALAQAVVTRPGHVVALVDAIRPVVVVVARSADATADAAQIVKALIGRFGGKGGGRSEGAQAGGLDAEPHAIRLAAYDLLSGGGSPPSSSTSR
jgi:alanyl-tRNA synthetase